MNELTCPRCGADGKVIIPGFTKYDCLSAHDGGKFHQHARCQRIELDRLRAIVEPLERLLDKRGEVRITSDGRDNLVWLGSRTFIGATLAEVLAKAAAELEGPE